MNFLQREHSRSVIMAIDQLLLRLLSLHSTISCAFGGCRLRQAGRPLWLCRTIVDGRFAEGG